MQLVNKVCWQIYLHCIVFNWYAGRPWSTIRNKVKKDFPSI